MKRLNLQLPDSLLERLKALAEKVEMTVTEMVRRAIEDYLKEKGV